MSLAYTIDRLTRRCPPRGWSINGYARWFPRTAALLLRTLDHFQALCPREADEEKTKSVAVVVGPWVSTAAPWYSIMVSLALARRGRRVVVIWDDSGFPESEVAKQNETIGRVLARVGQRFPVIKLTDQPPAESLLGDAAHVDLLAEANATWALRGVPDGPARAALVDSFRRSLAGSLPRVRTALDRAEVDCVVTVGGIYGTSGLFQIAAKERGCRAATFDAAEGVVFVSVDGIAGQNEDSPKAFEWLWGQSSEVREQAVATAKVEFARRAAGSDAQAFQSVAQSGSSSVGRDFVLVPLNVEWDTAALAMQRHFSSTQEWLTTAIEEVLSHSRRTVVVRQHPAERRPLLKSELDLAGLLDERFGGDSRVRLVAADAPISSYDLLHDSSLVLPFTSNIGVEAAALGLPVVPSGAPHYLNLGFVWSATSRQHYLDLVRAGAAGELPQLPEQHERAWLCYYLLAVRNPVWSDFTPQPVDFWSWCRRSPDELFAEPAVHDVIESIDTGTPLSVLRHLRSVGLADTCDSVAAR